MCFDWRLPRYWHWGVSFLESGLTVETKAKPDSRGDTKKAASKTKYTCPNCEQNARAKPGAALICGVCYEEDSEICIMEEA